MVKIKTGAIASFGEYVSQWKFSGRNINSTTLDNLTKFI
jgi:hypothetical protein